LPPSSFFIEALPSALPAPKKYTNVMSRLLVEHVWEICAYDIRYLG
jgi:hypothetical protein